MDPNYPILFTTTTITLSTRTLKHNNKFTHTSNIFQPFMSSHDLDQKTSFVSILAVILGLGGFTTSLISLCVEWLIPATKAKMPAMDEQTIASRHRLRSGTFSAHHLRKKSYAPALRRHSSFHPELVSMIGPRPTHGRQVSFSLEAPKYSSTPNTLPRKSYSPDCPFAPKDLAGSSDSSPRSFLPTEDSGTLLSSPSPSRTNDLSAQCHDAKCDCHSSLSMTPLELDVRPAFSNPSSPLVSPRQLLGKHIPSMRKAFSSKRRTSSSASTTTMAELEPSMRSELLRSSLDSPNVTAASIVDYDSGLGTVGSTSSDGHRSAFVRPFLPSRSKTVPQSPHVSGQEPDASRKPNVGFSNPWLISRHRTATSETSSISAEAFLSSSKSQQSPGRGFIRRFSSSKPSTPALAELPEPSYFAVKRAKTVQPTVRRTEPYGPPYNFPMPSKCVHSKYREEPYHARTSSDSMPVVEKKRTLRRTRRFKLKRTVTAFPRQYPQDDLVEVLDKKLSALKSTQALERNFHPRYILGSESDASPETSRSQVLLTTGWCASVKRRVVSDSRPMIR